ncbi:MULTISPECIES: hypothetical protein [unclassified Enterococcus]|uniref:hypothetical protein n=1 Tax=unclassified Enterococcus TaxID=2608891 RepID=UPI0013EB3F1A|nr:MULTISPECIES: hypothetical protein [unclassified Enterococcus]
MYVEIVSAFLNSRLVAQIDANLYFFHFIIMYLLRYGLSIFFAIYLFVVIVKRLIEYLSGGGHRRNRRRFKKQLSASYKKQQETIRENYEKGITDTDELKKNVYTKTK